MNAKIVLRVRPFSLPNFVTIEVPSSEPTSRSDPPPAATMAIPDLDAETLSILCDEFRAAIFAKAKKQDPEAIPTPPRTNEKGDHERD